MNVQETLQILSALKACGASHFKSGDFEVRMNVSPSLEPLQMPTPQPEPAHVQAPSQSTPENKEATEKLQGLIKTLNLPLEQLVDVIFPAGAGPGA